MKINSDNLNQIINELKNLFEVEKVDENRKNQIAEMVNKYGYIPYSHIRALKELSEAETIIALEEKLKLNNTYTENYFTFEETSAVKRAGFQNADWIKKEQHNIKLTNLAGLGNGNSSKEPGKFIDWLRQLVTMPVGKPEEGILSTTVYLIPFHPREFGCAYIPQHSGVSPGLEDKLIKSTLNLNAKDQVRLFVALCQLAGHPVMYDVLPQTGRFSKITLSKPFVARWFDISELTGQLITEINRIKEELKQDNNPEDVEVLAKILIDELSGNYKDVPEHLQELFNSFAEKLMTEKKRLSDQMMTEKNQKQLHKKAKKVICEALERAECDNLEEEDITDHGKVIETLIKKGLWPAPGGSWNSAGTPVFDKMSEGARHPTFKHYDYQGNDVTHFGNLDCQTPYYFVCLESGKYNEEVIEFFINFLKNLRKQYNFDAYRVDHLDHISDVVSEENGVPIRYRAPASVLRRMNEELNKEIPYFATLAEYMLWDDLLKEYHQDMKFDVLWGNDIVSQYQKNVSRIIKDNSQLEEYNLACKDNRKLSILKVYNNQDGEFREINQYPGQLGEEGALFKWFKLKFIPGGKDAQRPVMFIDGDESFTKLGIEQAIGAEESMAREDHQHFFEKFDAINKFAAKNSILEKGKARLHKEDNVTGFVSWLVELRGKKEKLFIIANEKPPTEWTKIKDGAELEDFEQVENKPINNVSVEIPEGFSVKSEFTYNEQLKDFEEKTQIEHLTNNALHYKIIKPSEFYIYKLIEKQD